MCSGQNCHILCLNKSVLVAANKSIHVLYVVVKNYGVTGYVLLYTDHPLWCATPPTRQHIIICFILNCVLSLLQHLAGHTVRLFLSF